MKGMDELFQP
jgi:Ran GTPase-activating protein (RanGAP) involved in mRNA processing and transport